MKLSFIFLSTFGLVEDKVFYFLARQVQGSVRGGGGAAQGGVGLVRADQCIDGINRIVGQHVGVELG